ncbi:hypothetical protein J1614_011896 [Plenodomus biglobosus]|nr:hypothetical protein J1614_011896 [Plenodomus biglobosus]
MVTRRLSWTKGEPGETIEVVRKQNWGKAIGTVISHHLAAVPAPFSRPLSLKCSGPKLPPIGYLQLACVCGSDSSSPTRKKRSQEAQLLQQCPY